MNLKIKNFHGVYKNETSSFVFNSKAEELYLNISQTQTIKLTRSQNLEFTNQDFGVSLVFELNTEGIPYKIYGTIHRKQIKLERFILVKTKFFNKLSINLMSFIIAASIVALGFYSLKYYVDNKITFFKVSISTLKKNCIDGNVNHCFKVVSFYEELFDYQSIDSVLSDACDNINREKICILLADIYKKEISLKSKYIPFLTKGCDRNYSTLCYRLAHHHTNNNSKQFGLLQKSCNLQNAYACQEVSYQYIQYGYFEQAKSFFKTKCNNSNEIMCMRQKDLKNITLQYKSCIDKASLPSCMTAMTLLQKYNNTKQYKIMLKKYCLKSNNKICKTTPHF